MKHIQDGYRGLSLVMGLNFDRLASVLMITFALLLGTYLSAVL